MDIRAIPWPEIDLYPHALLSLSLRSPEPPAILQDPTLEIKFQLKILEIRLDFITGRKKER